MKFIQLQYFIEVVKQKSITKAAKKLYVSQPAISFAIKELELEFKTTLFIRYNNQLTLTDEGYHLYTLAVPLIENFINAKDDMTAFLRGNNVLKVGIPPMLGTILVSPILKKYSEHSPNTTIQLVELGSLQNQKAIVEGDLELGLSVIKDGIIDENLDYFKIATTNLYLTVSKDHPLSKKDIVSINDLGNSPLVLMKDDCLQSEIITNLFNEKGLKPNIKIRTNQLYTIKELLLNNNLCGFIFNQIVEKENNLVAIPIKEEINLQIVLAWKKGSILNKTCEDFKNFLIESTKQS